MTHLPVSNAAHETNIEGKFHNSLFHIHSDYLLKKAHNNYFIHVLQKYPAIYISLTSCKLQSGVSGMTDYLQSMELPHMAV